MNRSIDVMVNKLCSILGDNIISIYLYGSVVMSDFKLGWSDIDILCLTKRVLSEPEAERLVNLRQDLLAEDAGNQYYRSFEGAILSFDEFREKEYERVVYWGTSGQRITDNYGFDAFSLFELIKYGDLIYGAEIREQLKLPTREELLDNVQRHYQTIRKYAVRTDDTIYSCGWLLDISRCIYTLRYNDIISKTKAGEWALEENLCPDKECMLRTLQIRKNPLKYKEDEAVKKWFCSLGESVQLFADVLEEENAKHRTL